MESDIPEGPPMDTRVHIEANVADMATARRHTLENSCTYYDENSHLWRLRPYLTTGINEIGEYGLGFGLYFDFVKRTGWVLLAMAILCTLLMALDFLGDFSGIKAGFFAQSTIGNIGVCGAYGEICPQVVSYPYRYLISGHDILLRDWTPAFGGLATVAIAIFAIFSFWYYYSYQPRARRVFDEQHVTPTDYAAEVDLLPARLGDDQTHRDYETLLRDHFEKVAGKEGSVVEVAIARDYNGAIRKFKEIHSRTVEIRELKARIRRSPDERSQKSLSNALRKLETKRAHCEEAVTKEALTEEQDRNVCKAFIIFSETHFKRRVVDAYKVSNQSMLFRLIMPRALKFLSTYRIRVRPTNEPETIYHENLDVSRSERRARRAFTVLATFLILILAFAALLFAQTATRTGSSLGIGSMPVWIVANASATTGTCFETCGVSFFSDSKCTVPITAPVVGMFESSGTFTSASLQSAGNSSSCTLGSVWRSDRCEVVEAKGDPWSLEDITVPSPAKSPKSRHRNLLETPNRPLPKRRVFGRANRSQRLFSAIPSMKSGSVLLPESSSLCLEKTCPGSTVSQCFSSAQQCDGVWNCNSGFDEAFDSSDMACPLTCGASFSDKCPGSGLCIDPLAGTCGNDCQASSPFASDSVCTSINSRLIAEQSSSLEALPDCDASKFSEIIGSNYGGNCPGLFVQNPCCVLDNLVADQRNALSLCSASSVVDDVQATYSGLSALGYMEAYCVSFSRIAALPSNLECSPDLISQVVAISPNCRASMTSNRRWCECLSDLALLPPSTFESLESCHVSADSARYFGFKTGFNHLNTFGDMVRLGCQDSADTISSVARLTQPSPYLVFGTQVTTAVSSSQDFLDEITMQLSTSVLSADYTVWAYVNGTLATIRIEIYDRSNATDQSAWNQTVLDTYNLVSAQLTDLLPTRTSDRLVVSMEEHCPDSPAFFQCPITRTCLSADAYVCDGVPDCEIVQNGEVTSDDELNCWTDSEADCFSNEFQCLAGTRRCIPNLFWCDGIQDCSDGSDETGSDCDLQKSVGSLTNATFTLTDEYQAMEFIGFVFDDDVAVQCISIDQPDHSLTTVVEVFGCELDVVFRQGQGLALRYPDSNCIKVQSSAIHPDAVAASSLLNPGNLVYSVFQPSQVVACSLEPADECPILTGSPYAYCDGSMCKYPVSGQSAQFSVSTNPICDLGSPISPAAAQTLVLRYTDASTGSVNSDILKEVTYTCFCEQQAQYHSSTDSLYSYPPFRTEIQLACATYYNKQILDQLINLGGIILVCVVNVLLTIVMYWLVELEKPTSLTGKESAELWKLFLAQFITTALLIVLVHARFYDSRFTFAGLGEGEFIDTSKDWFVKVGASLCLSMFGLIIANTVPFLILEWLARWLRRRKARKCVTQEAMNRALELPDFKLSFRIATYLTSLAVCVMYVGPMPIMAWTMTITAFVMYWYDKFFFLRCCKRPPMYSDSTMTICLRLMPIIVLANLMIMVWTFSNQQVFPSDVVSQSWSDALQTSISESDLVLYISGRLSFVQDLGQFRTYIETRIVDSLRKAPFGGVVLLGLVILFFVIRLIVYILQISLFALFRFAAFVLEWGCCGRRRRMGAMRRSRSNWSADVGNVEPEPPFVEAKATMGRQNMLSSYKLENHPQYKEAYNAINRVKRHSIRRASQSPRSSPKPEQAPKRAAITTMDSADSLGASVPKPVVSPQSEAPAVYPTIDDSPAPAQRKSRRRKNHQSTN